MYGADSISKFVGKTVEAAFINDSKDVMSWKVDGKWYDLNAIGDCCSHSWFEHCDNADVFNGGTILEIEHFSGDTENGEYGNEIKVDMLKIKTDKGHCTIEFRNESNGYYSGWIDVFSSMGHDKDMKPMTDF